MSEQQLDSKKVSELIAAYDEYVELLGNNPAETIAYIHKFRHSEKDIQKGKTLRERIARLKLEIKTP